MRVLLIMPPYERLKGFKVNYFPNNLGQLATCLEEAQHYARIYNADACTAAENINGSYSEKNRSVSQDDYIRVFSDENHYVWKEIKQTIVDFSPDLVGISSMTATLPVALKIARISKEINKTLPVVIGGCHATVMPRDVIKREDVDYVVQGEGEILLVQLCNALESQKGGNLQSINGLFYKENGKIIQNKPNSFIDDLSSLPLINRDLVLYPERYNSESYSRIFASRGCPYQCTFCSSPAIWKRKVRYQNPEKIIEELNYLNENYNVRRFLFWDDTFTANKKKVLQFCRLLKQNSKQFVWSCFVRANTVDEEIVKNLKETGCRTISLGIESGSDRILKLMKKGITVEMIRKAVDLIKKENFLLNSFWIIGIPYETEKDMLMTVDLMNELELDHINFCTFTPEPMTELYDLCIKEGLLEEEVDWATKLDLSHHSPNNHFNKNVSYKRYLEIYNNALKIVDYKNQKTLRRKIKSFWIQKRYFCHRDAILQRLKLNYERIRFQSIIRPNTSV